MHRWLVFHDTLFHTQRKLDYAEINTSVGGHGNVYYSSRYMSGAIIWWWMIPEKYLSEINDVYMEILPEHSRIVADCEQMHNRVNIYRKKAKFPKRAYWTPPGRELNEEKKLFLQGLSAQVAFLKMATIKDCCTGRVVEYAAVSESQCKHSRICCCYVTLTNKAQSSSTLWSDSVFEHQFVAKMYQWAIVEEYTDPVKIRSQNYGMLPCFLTHRIQGMLFF